MYIQCLFSASKFKIYPEFDGIFFANKTQTNTYMHINKGIYVNAYSAYGSGWYQ